MTQAPQEAERPTPQLHAEQEFEGQAGKSGLGGHDDIDKPGSVTEIAKELAERRRNQAAQDPAEIDA